VADHALRGRSHRRRFLAAHAFANWAIHLGSGLESWLVSIETANAFLQAGAGVRHADLVLRHLTDHEPENLRPEDPRTREPENEY
jgi:hypothetical protein